MQADRLSPGTTLPSGNELYTDSAYDNAYGKQGSRKKKVSEKYSHAA